MDTLHHEEEILKNKADVKRWFRIAARRRNRKRGQKAADPTALGIRKARYRELWKFLRFLMVDKLVPVPPTHTEVEVSGDDDLVVEIIDDKKKKKRKFQKSSVLGNTLKQIIRDQSEAGAGNDGSEVVAETSMNVDNDSEMAASSRENKAFSWEEDDSAAPLFSWGSGEEDAGNNRAFSW